MGLIYLQITFFELTPREREKEDLSSLMRSPSRARRGYSADPSLILTDPSHSDDPSLILTDPSHSADPSPSTHPSSSSTHLRRPICLHSFPSKTHLLSFPSRFGILWSSYSVFLFCLYDLVEVVTIICFWLQLICICCDSLVLGKVFEHYLENVSHAKPNIGNTFLCVFYRTQPNRKKKCFLFYKIFYT